MTIKQKVKIECIKNNISITTLSKKLEMNSSQLLYHHLDRKNLEILIKIEKILNLKEGALLQE